MEKTKPYDYLVSLNIEFDQLRIQILGRETFPPLNKLISLIRQEKSRQSLMLSAVSGENIISSQNEQE